MEEEKQTIKLSRDFNGSYDWEIKNSGKNVDEVIKDFKGVDNKLKEMFGDK